MVAVVSDIHGNLEALQAVFEDMKAREVDLTVNLGDVVSGPLFPAECADLVIPLAFPTLRGNHERQLLTLDRQDMGQTDRYTANCLRSDHFTWIASSPKRCYFGMTYCLCMEQPITILRTFLRLWMSAECAVPPCRK